MPETEVWVQNAGNRRWDDKAKAIAKVRKHTYKIKFEYVKCSYRNTRETRVLDGNGENSKSVTQNSKATTNRGPN